MKSGPIIKPFSSIYLDYCIISCVESVVISERQSLTQFVLRSK